MFIFKYNLEKFHVFKGIFNIRTYFYYYFQRKLIKSFLWDKKFIVL